MCPKNRDRYYDLPAVLFDYFDARLLPVLKFRELRWTTQHQLAAHARKPNALDQHDDRPAQFSKQGNLNLCDGF